MEQVVVGKFNRAIIFTNVVEKEALDQVKAICNLETYQGCKIAFMPDIHAGKGCTIGTTIKFSDKIDPSFVGVDISCGVTVVELEEKSIDFEKLDSVIRQYVPNGFGIHEKEHQNSSLIDFNRLHCIANVNIQRAKQSIGSLGGGNHFIEIDKNPQNGSLFLVVHCGSRNFGLQVAQHYIQKGKEYCRSIGKDSEEYVFGKDFQDYLDDCVIVDKYAEVNRKTIVDIILEKMNLHRKENGLSFTTKHNYVDVASKIVRKGAVRACKGENLIIPINMAYGSLLCVGKGSSRWNYSAPHGAGRILSRNKARKTVSMDDFRDSMKGIFTNSVNEKTLDESPMSYKDANDIIDNIGETVDIKAVLKPVFNFKAS